MRIWKRIWTFSSAGYSSDGPFRRMNKKQLHTTTSTIKLLLYYIYTITILYSYILLYYIYYINYTIQLYKRQVFLRAHYLLNWKQSWVYSRGSSWSISLWIINCVQSQCISSASVKFDSAVWSGECRKLMMFSNVIVDITFPLRPHVFTQSCCEVSASLSGVESLAVGAIDLINRSLSKNNYNADFIRRNIHPPIATTETNHNATPTTTATIPYIKGMYENILGILKPFNIHVAHKLITNLRQLRTNVKNKERFIQSTL